MNDRARPTPWQIVQVAAAVAVLLLFLFQARSILNPLVLFLLLWAVLSPFRGRPGHAGLLMIVGALTLAWTLASTGTLLAPFVLALVLAYVLDPLADRLQGRGIGRGLAVVMLIVPVAGVLAVLFLVAIPAALRELGEVLEAVPELLERLAEWLEQSQGRLIDVDVPFIEVQALVDRLRSIDSATVVEFVNERRSAIAAAVWSGVLGLGRGIGSVVTVLGYVALTPVLTFYLIRDWDRITEIIVDLVPPKRRPAIVSFAHDAHRLVSAYLRGQITVAIIVGLLTGVGLALASFPYAATLGLIVAVFSIIPYLGLVLSLVPAIVIALVSGSIWLSLLKVAIVYGGAQTLEATVITPKIVGESVGIHPVWIVLALAVGGFFFGFVGLLLAVPTAAVVKLLIARAVERYKASDIYLSGDISTAD